jgi:hypothetical protein
MGRGIRPECVTGGSPEVIWEEPGAGTPPVAGTSSATSFPVPRLAGQEKAESDEEASLWERARNRCTRQRPKFRRRLSGTGPLPLEERIGEPTTATQRVRVISRQGQHIV